MKPTEILSAEHRVIEQVLDCLEAIAARARQRRTLDLESAEQALDFVRSFADACHHGKEEHQLFPMMTERGIPRHVGPLAVMLDEHEIGRAHVRAMAAALVDARANDPTAVQRFAEEAEGDGELLREHIAKEDNVLFPMAEACLSDADRARVLAAFERVEHHDMPAGTHERMVQIADELARRFDVRLAAERGMPALAHGCGSHSPTGCGHHR